jgi:hypothetical protein
MTFGGISSSEMAEGGSWMAGSSLLSSCCVASSRSSSMAVGDGIVIAAVDLVMNELT